MVKVAKEMAEEAREELAEEMRREAQRYWPVDTGRSRRGLISRVRGNVIQFSNRYAYAFWVERRWFQLDKFFRPRMRRILKRVQRRSRMARRRLEFIARLKDKTKGGAQDVERNFDKIGTSADRASTKVRSFGRGRSAALGQVGTSAGGGSRSIRQDRPCRNYSSRSGTSHRCCCC